MGAQKYLDPRPIQAIPIATLRLVVDMFESEVPSTLERLQTFLGEGDAESMGEEAHRLKGSCLSLGAVSMAEELKILQDFGFSKSLEKVPVHLERLAELFPPTLSALQQELQVRIDQES
ncbi:Hpt domain-containing protein [Sulfidibacter corallicola]|uniref:Hpt domain-containing protein n=1 Tax=Sulfidibacter corallicola TaxID=2818388 RepID=A0A8A4TH03_SULCO|nr:Hpt domain-containing protein [Sulfidibacter corallicola]QTD48081.1 Hpt domain-containing protein [Sulfidibacter corallicola]